MVHPGQVVNYSTQEYMVSMPTDTDKQLIITCFLCSYLLRVFQGNLKSELFGNFEELRRIASGLYDKRKDIVGRTPSPPSELFTDLEYTLLRSSRLAVVGTIIGHSINIQIILDLLRLGLSLSLLI